MKIAILAAHDLVADPRARWEAETLAAAGHRVTVYGTDAPGLEPEEDAAGVVYVRVPLRGWRASSDPSNPVRAARWFERMEPVVAGAAGRDPPEVLHAIGLETAAPAAAHAARLRIPFVFEAQEALASDRLPRTPSARNARSGKAALALLRRRAASLERRTRTHPSCAASVADSDALADEIARRFGVPRPVVVRSCPPFRAPLRTDALRRRLGVARSAKLVVLSGPLHEGSGVETAVRALRLLAERYLLVLVGATPRLAPFERLAEAEGVAARVRFVAPSPADETADLVASADVAIVPTEPIDAATRNAIPPRLFHALAAGVPVVASDTCDVGAIVRGTGAGVLYPARSPQDPAALAEGIHTIASDPSLAATCGDAARHAVRTRLNWETESLRLVDLYDELGAR